LWRLPAYAFKDIPQTSKEWSDGTLFTLEIMAINFYEIMDILQSKCKGYLGSPLLNPELKKFISWSFISMPDEDKLLGGRYFALAYEYLNNLTTCFYCKFMIGPPGAIYCQAVLLNVDYKKAKQDVNKLPKSKQCIFSHPKYRAPRNVICPLAEQVATFVKPTGGGAEVRDFSEFTVALLSGNFFSNVTESEAISEKDK